MKQSAQPTLRDNRPTSAVTALIVRMSVIVTVPFCLTCLLVPYPSGRAVFHDCNNHSRVTLFIFLQALKKR